MSLATYPDASPAVAEIDPGSSEAALGPVLGHAELLPFAVQRMTVELLNDAIADLRSSRNGGFDEGIHSARKKLKRTRALLRLVRDPIGYRPYREQNVVLRDTARTLSGVRDAWVLVETLRKLRDEYSHLLDEATFTHTEGWLMGRHQEAIARFGARVIVNAVTNLGTARSVFAAFPVEEWIEDDFGAIAGGIARVYRRGYRAHEQARETHSIQNFHEWRKRVKYLGYQMEALTPIQPGLIGAMADELGELGSDLGEDHDLAVLAEAVAMQDAACPDPQERWLLLAAIYQARHEIQERGLRRGAALFAEKPQDFVGRVDAYWIAGRR